MGRASPFFGNKKFHAKQKVPRLFGRGTISRVFAKSGLKQPSQFPRPWRKLPDRQLRDTTACSLIKIRDSDYSHALASTACQYKPLRLTVTTACSLNHDSRLPTIRMLSPPRLVNTSRSGSHLAIALNVKTPHSQGAGRISRVFAKSGLKQPSRF